VRLMGLVNGVKRLVGAMSDLDQWTADEGGRPEGDIDAAARWYFDRMGACVVHTREDGTVYTAKADFWEWYSKGASWEDLYWEASISTPRIGPVEHTLRNAVRRLERAMAQATSVAATWKSMDAEREILKQLAEQAHQEGR